MPKNTARQKHASSDKSSATQRNRAAARARSRRVAKDEREIGAIPRCKNPARRAKAEADLIFALKTYFPEKFYLPFSANHREVVATMKAVLKDGGLFALGMPRGSGKTTIVICCVVLALCFGWRRFLTIIGPTQAHASGILEAIKAEFESNDLLLADFPELCYPIRCLEFQPSRARGQTSLGVNTMAKWDGKKRIVLPTVANRIGAVVHALSLLGNMRGLFHVTPKGETLRPDCFVGDDLQTDASARRIEQIAKRESILNGSVLGLAGPGKNIAGITTITVILRGDLADRLLDSSLNPVWQGRRYKLVEKWPDNLELWERYAEARELDLARKQPHLPSATKFYKANRAAMDAGAIVPWEQRFEPGEVSALQSAFNLKLSKPLTFDAEYQNEPAAAVTAEGIIQSPEADQILTRINGYQRGEIPQGASHLFAGIDVQKDALFWVLLAVDSRMTGWVVDYGSWPDQPFPYWTLRQVSTTIAMATGIKSLEGSLFAALERLVNPMLSGQWHRDDGAIMRLETALVDANWGDSTSTVYSFCRQTKFSNLLPFHGRGITAKQQPIAARKKKLGERAGEAWFIPSVKGTKIPRHVIADANMIKSLIAGRFRQELGEPGCWSLFKGPPQLHRMFADHLAAEYPIETSGRGRTLTEWVLRPGRDNHFLDCLVMATTAALMAGCAVNGSGSNPKPPKKPRRSLAEMKAARKRRDDSEW